MSQAGTGRQLEWSRVGNGGPGEWRRRERTPRKPAERKVVARDEQKVRRLGDSGVSGISLWKSPLLAWLRAPPVRDGQASNDCADSLHGSLGR